MWSESPSTRTAVLENLALNKDGMRPSHIAITLIQVVSLSLPGEKRPWVSMMFSRWSFGRKDS